MVSLVCEVKKPPKQTKTKMKTPPNLIYTENREQSVCGGERRAKLVKGVERYKLPLIK